MGSWEIDDADDGLLNVAGKEEKKDDDDEEEGNK